ncbi:MAG: hypothetical protein EAZ85_07775 [Bacteroidetes bacterium]|nr:MAG: hypothetical protein EAZ85_07775 [Bacteroidota bacterium]TAG90200.1 MAG: hypothetical protein EAZ20_04940 [Bacteroidota bacterium]
MKLKEIATISGKPGLFRIFKPTKGGVIIEAIDEKKAKTIVSSTHKVSILHEVSIYTTTKEGSVPLADVLRDINNKFNGVLPIIPQSDNKVLLDFLEDILPEYDKEKVKPSDVKKLLTWYNILTKYTPATFDTLHEVEEQTTETETETAEAK